MLIFNSDHFSEYNDFTLNFLNILSKYYQNLIDY